jgi:hypothetical protein
LYMLLALASAVILGSESLGTRDHILLSDLRLPISSPPTTRRVTMEVFDPASRRSLGSSLYNLGEDQTENTVSNSYSIVMGGCLAIARISYLRERVYRTVAHKWPFIYSPIS